MIRFVFLLSAAFMIGGLVLIAPALAQTSAAVIAYRAADAARQVLMADPATRPRQLLLFYPDPAIPGLYRADKWWINVESAPGIDQYPLFTSGGLAEAASNAAAMGFKPTHGVNYQTGKVFTLAPTPATAVRVPAEMIDWLHERLHENGPVCVPYVEPAPVVTPN